MHRVYHLELLFLLSLVCAAVTAGCTAAAGDVAASADQTDPMLSDKDWFDFGRPRLGMQALDENTVPVPWRPVEYLEDRASVAVWNREYVLAGSSLLAAVKCGPVHLMAGPMELHLRVAGTQGVLAFGEPSVMADRSGRGRLTLRRTGSCQGVEAEWVGVIEYDGLVWSEISITPPGDGRTLDRLYCSIPLAGETAKLVHYVGAPERYTTQNAPSLSFSKELPPTPGNHHKSGLKTMLWVGNTSHGLLWCVESDQCWWPKQRSDCLRLDRREDGTVVFTVEMVSRALPAGAPRTLVYTFGLMATPVKPLPDGWRGWTLSAQRDTLKGDRRGSHLIYWPDEYRYMSLDPDPLRYVNTERLRRKIAADTQEGRFIIPYWSRLNVCPESMEPTPGSNTPVRKVLPRGRQMQAEWGVSPNNPSPASSNAVYRLSAASGWADYLVWCVESFAARFGRLDGVYLDEVQPVPNVRAESGGGYDDWDGRRRPTFEFHGTRNLIKRIAYNTYNRNKTRPRIIAHCSATHTLNSLSGCDGFLIGEHLNVAYLRSHPEFLPPASSPGERLYYYSYALPMDRLRAECFGRQWGMVMFWLPQFKGLPGDIMNSPAATRDMLSRVMQADMLVWPLWCNADEVHKTWMFRKDFDIADSVVDFVPYWENRVINAEPVGGGPSADEIVVGYYRNPDKGTYLVLVSNLGRQACDVRLDFGTVPVKSLADAETRGRLAPDSSGQWRLRLNRNDYKALRVNY